MMTRDADVTFSDEWSECIYSEEHVKREVEQDPAEAQRYHVSCTNITYAQFVEDQRQRNSQ